METCTEGDAVARLKQVVCHWTRVDKEDEDAQHLERHSLAESPLEDDHSRLLIGLSQSDNLT